MIKRGKLESRFSFNSSPFGEGLGRGFGFRLIYKSQLQIQNLRRTRDLLLSRLLSGKINLGEIEL